MILKKNKKYNYKFFSYTGFLNDNNIDSIYYRVKNTILLLNKIRRLMLARVKKIIKKKK